MLASRAVRAPAPAVLPEIWSMARSTSAWRLAGRLAVMVILGLVIVASALWTALALWFRLPGGEVIQAVAAGLWCLLALAAIAALFSRHRRTALGCYAAAFLGAVLWWSTI